MYEPRSIVGGVRLGSAPTKFVLSQHKPRDAPVGQCSALHLEPSPNQIRSLNLIRESLGGRGQLETRESGSAAPNQIQWRAPALARHPGRNHDLVLTQHKVQFVAPQPSLC